MLESFKSRVAHKGLSAVYRIHCPATNQDYVGATINLQTRMNRHIHQLKCGHHHNPALQQMYDKYGRPGLRLEIVQECLLDVDEIYEKECEAYYTTFAETRVNTVPPSKIVLPNSEPRPITVNNSSVRAFLFRVVNGERENDCWGWKGQVNKGYATFSYYDKGHRKVTTNRFSYVMFYGIQPGRLLVRHSCDNPLCSNPRHMELGTDKDNGGDRTRRFRSKHNLNSEIVRNIRNDYVSGIRLSQLNEKYGFNVINVVNNRCFKDDSYTFTPQFPHQRMNKKVA